MSKQVVEYPLSKIVEIWWRDSSGRIEWDSLESHRDSYVALCKTVGYLLRKDDKEVVVVSSQSAGGGGFQSITIPRECITKMRVAK